MAKMATISSLHNQKVQMGIGIVAVLVLALGIMIFWKNPQSAGVIDEGMQEATEYDKKSALLKTTGDELTVVGESLKTITNKVKSSLREKYKIDCDL